VLKGTKESIAIVSEVLKDGLLAVKLAFVVGIASIELAGQLGTVVRMGVSGSLDGVATGRWALISLNTVMSVMEQVV